MRTRKEIENEWEGPVTKTDLLILEVLLDIRELLEEQKAKRVPCPLCHDSKCNGSRHFQVGAGAAGPNLPTYGTNE